MKQNSLQKTWRILSPLLIYYLIKNVSLYLMIHILQALQQSQLPAPISTLGTSQNASLAIANGLASMIGGAFLYRNFLEETSCRGEDDPDKNVFARTIMRFGNSWTAFQGKRLRFLLVCLLAMTSAVTMNMVITLISFTSDTYNEVKDVQYSVPIAIGIILYAVISPIVEEIIFRGLTYTRMKQFFNRKLSIIVVSFMFGAFHGNIVQGIYAFILGILITLAYDWTTSFWGAILFHASANLAIYLLSVTPLGKINFVTPISCVLFGTISILFGFILYKSCKKD